MKVLGESVSERRAPRPGRTAAYYTIGFAQRGGRR